MPSNLEQAVEEFRIYSERASSLYDATVRCFQDMKSEAKLSEKAMAVMLSPTEIEETGRALKRRPSVLFIGNRNCGKSAILNELLKGSYLPVEETPCTSRIVKISNSTGENTIRVVNKAGIEVQALTKFTKNLARDFVVVSDRSREELMELNSTVEMKLNHPLLKSGIELIDSPGRNENDALDDVVDTFFAKGTTPLIVYIIDGNEQLRPSDRETIRSLQDKCPEVSIMFVCNKVDISAAAQKFDDHSSSDDDSEDGEKPDKQKPVFCQLQKYGYLPEDESIGSCSNFHGISALDVRNERRKNEKSKATEMFGKFEKCLLETLEQTVKRQTKQVIGKLLFLMLSFVAAVRREKGHLSQKMGVIEFDLDNALDVEKSVLREVTAIIASEEKVKSIVKCQLINLEVKCLAEANEFKPTKTVYSAREAEELVKNTLRLKMSNLPSHLHEVRTALLRFLTFMKGMILDKIFNDLRCAVATHLQATTCEIEQLTTRYSSLLGHPLPRLYLDATYPSARSQSTVGLMEKLKQAVSAELRKELSEILNAEWKSFDLHIDISKKESRRKVVEIILSNFSEERIAESITRACKFILGARHKAFVKTMVEVSHIGLLSSLKCSQQLKELDTLYTSRVKCLAVRGYALDFSLCKGKLTLGSFLKSTKHSKIYRCAGWSEEVISDACVVKVVEKAKVEGDVWEQTSKDLIHSWEIQCTVGQACKNLVRLYGWLTPNPETLHVLMEKAEEDLTTSLQRGLSLKMRMKVAMDVANGVKEVHSARYIHQDLKADSVLLMKDGTAKINMAKPEKPFEKTSQGTPFHISREMYQNYGKGLGSHSSYDIYAFGMFLWVLCEGCGTRRPQAYENYSTTDAMKIAVGRDIFPERPTGTPDACWELMMKCWKQRFDLTIGDVLNEIRSIFVAA